MIADKEQIIKLLQSNIYTAYGLEKEVESMGGKMSKTIIGCYMHSVGNPNYSTKKVVNVGNMSLDNAIILTQIANKVLGTKTKSSQRIKEELEGLKNELEVTSGKDTKLALQAKITTLEWVLSSDEPIYIF